MDLRNMQITNFESQKFSDSLVKIIVKITVKIIVKLKPVKCISMKLVIYANPTISENS